MADAGQSSPILTTPRLTTNERLVVHGVAFVATSRIFDERLDTVVDQLRRAVGRMDAKAHTEALRLAGKFICEAYPRRSMRGGGPDWMIACMDAARISQNYHWAALCALDGV
ncbi:MAG: hypothetical protein ACOH2H_16115 [Cypionkella sp.]